MLIRCMFNAGLQEEDVGDYSHYFEDCHSGELDYLKHCLDGGSILDYAAQGFEHYGHLVESLAKYSRFTRPLIRKKVTQHPPFSQSDDSALNNSFDSVLRQWLMLNVRNRADGLIYTPHSRCIRWNDEIPLLEFVRSQFALSNRLPPRKSRRRLKHSFTAMNLKNYSSIEVTWTYCLADHLKYNPEYRTVSIFANRRILWDILKDRGAAFTIPRYAVELDWISQRLGWDEFLVGHDWHDIS
jgi:hypothetical protein